MLIQQKYLCYAKCVYITFKFMVITSVLYCKRRIKIQTHNS